MYFATDGSDYTEVTMTITFEAGETEFRVPVATIGDQLAEQQEDFFATLSNPSSGLTVGAADRAIVNIADNDSEQMAMGALHLHLILYPFLYRIGGPV